MPIGSALVGLFIILLVLLASRAARLDPQRRLPEGPRPNRSVPDREPIAWEIERGPRQGEEGVPPIFVGSYPTLKQAQIEAQMAVNAEDKLPGRNPYFSVRPVYETDRV